MTVMPFEGLSALWAIASGVAVSILGLYALRGKGSRPRGGLPFGLFALTWGIQIAAINGASTIHSASVAQTLYLVALVALFPLPYFLTEFAASQTQERGRRGRWLLARLATGGLAVSLAGLLILKPSLLFEGVSIANGLFYPTWGPAFFLLVSLPFFILLGVTLFALHLSKLEAPTARTRRWSAFLLAGLGIYAGYTAGNNLLYYSDLAINYSLWPYWRVGLYLGVFVLLACLVLALGIGALHRWRQSSTVGESSREGWIAIALLVPIIAGILDGVLVVAGLPDFQLVGFWRLLGVGVITYGFARRRRYDLPQRVRRAGATASGSAGALAGGATAFGVGTVLTGGLLLPIAAGLAVTGATAMPALKWARRLFGVPDQDNPVEEAEQLYEQKIETYRAALEDAMARETLEQDAGFLSGLRRRFGISEEEDRILRYYARKATVPRREGDPDTAYERLRIIGEGGVGRTWLARDRSRDRLVVLKEPLERWHHEGAVLDAARREAKLAAKVRHPNVIEVEEVLEDDGRPILVMEYVPGGSLADKLRREGTLEPREAMRIGFDVAQGLHAIHQAGIVHRDLTPDNVLMTEDDRGLIADFGLARRLDSSGTKLFDDDAGTRGYQAPETARGSDDPSVDVYGLAAILHTCLYGSPPMEGTIQMETEVPQGLREIIEKGLSMDPGDRFEDAQAFAQALEELVER